MPRPPDDKGWVIFDTSKDHHTGWLYIGELTSARVASGRLGGRGGWGLTIFSPSPLFD